MSRDEKAKAGFVGVKPKGRKRVFALEETARAKLPPVPESMTGEIDAARERHKTRAASPGARVYTRKDGGWFIDAPHRDLEAWEVQICEAFGTRSHSVMWTFLSQLAELCRNRRRLHPDTGEFQDWVPDEYELNFILATIHSERPDTPLQAAMLAQMVANHMMQMRLGADILGHQGNYVAPDRAATFAKLTNAFANQAEVYLKLRGKSPKQTVTVTYTREVHVHHHRHAHAYPPGGGGEEISIQPQEAIEGVYVETNPGTHGATTGEPPIRPALPGPDPEGVVVPMRRAQGKEALPNPRRTVTRRTEG